MHFLSYLLFFISTLIIIYSYFIFQYFNSNPYYSIQKQVEFFELFDNLFSNGTPTQLGWSRHPIWTYRRDYISYSNIFIKEWDYYATFIEEKNIWICLTMSDLGYASLFSLSVIDLNLKKYNQIEEIKLFSLGNLNLPKNSLIDHNIEFKGKNLNIIFSKNNHKRYIEVNCDTFINPNGEKGIKAYFESIQDDNMESINIQTNWQHNRKLFYLNEKVNSLESTGEIIINNKKSIIKNKAFTVLDWGRGVWAYTGTWYWSHSSGIINGNKIGFNFGYGFSDRSPATENCIFFNNKIHKLNDVTFYMPEGDLLKKNWEIKSKDDRVNLIFKPLVNRQSKMNFFLIKSEQQQVFGIFEGKLILDNGKVIIINNLNGFAEKVYNRW